MKMVSTEQAYLGMMSARAASRESYSRAKGFKAHPTTVGAGTSPLPVSAQPMSNYSLTQEAEQPPMHTDRHRLSLFSYQHLSVSICGFSSSA
jgi:hypothetical protein